MFVRDCQIHFVLVQSIATILQHKIVNSVNPPKAQLEMVGPTIDSYNHSTIVSTVLQPFGNFAGGLTFEAKQIQKRITANGKALSSLSRSEASPMICSWSEWMISSESRLYTLVAD